MKQTRQLNSIITLFLLLGILILVVATTGYKIPGVQASGSAGATQSIQLPAISLTTTFAFSPTPTIGAHAITWADLVNYLEKDHTNWNTYIPGKYMCLDFSTDLVANATKQGIKAWIVTVDFTSPDPGHAFVAFETTDRGVVFVEPQADDTYPIVEIGHNLCDSWGVYQCLGIVSSIQYLQCDKAHYCTKYTP